MEGPGSTAPRLPLAAGERALWTRSVFSRAKLVFAFIRAVVAVWFDRSTLPRATSGVFHTPELSGYRATAGGDVLRLRTSTGHRILLTVPGAATAAALVNTQLDRRRATTGDDRC
jgi:hypothetical protein